MEFFKLKLRRAFHIENDNLLHVIRCVYLGHFFLGFLIFPLISLIDLSM